LAPQFQQAIEEVNVTHSEAKRYKVDGRETFATKRKPKRVILMIGDGMGLTQISAGMIVSKDNLAIKRFQHIGLMTTYSTKLITDSAASATAMSTGKKTYNGAIAMTLGKDNKKKAEKTILEYGEEAGWATGVVTTATVTHATPASFYGHYHTRSNANQILAAQFIEKDIEVLMGGGRQYFEQRDDKRNLIDEAQEKGYFVNHDLTTVGDYTTKKMIALVSPKLPGRLDERGDFLPLAAKKSTEILDSYKNFFLMIEGAQIDWGGHAENSDYIVEEMLDFDKTIANVLDFAEKDGQTLVIVTADHETGGYAIEGGDIKERTIKADFTSDYHTATMVPVFAYGPGAESFAGVYDNTDIFYKLKYLMGFSEKAELVKTTQND